MPLRSLLMISSIVKHLRADGDAASDVDLQPLASLDVSKDVIQHGPDGLRKCSAVTGRWLSDSAWTLQKEVSTFLVTQKSEFKLAGAQSHHGVRRHRQWQDYASASHCS